MALCATNARRAAAAMARPHRYRLFSIHVSSSSTTSAFSCQPVGRLRHCDPFGLDRRAARGALGPWSRIALAERSLRRGVELNTPAGHVLDAVTVASINAVLDRARAARLATPAEPMPAHRTPGPLLSIRAAQKPAESAMVGAALALLQALDAAPRARTERAHDLACARAAQTCIERTLPLLIPKLIESWTALRRRATPCGDRPGASAGFTADRGSGAWAAVGELTRLWREPGLRALRTPSPGLRQGLVVLGLVMPRRR
ncbi:MAG: hypothetical protein QM783_19050 [Phycisphaerales bacterium]